MASQLLERILIVSVVAITLVAPTQKSDGFAYVTTANDTRLIVHPSGYDGKGGELTVTLSLHPDFKDMEDEIAFTAEHIAAIWTSLLIWEPNLEPSLEIPKLGGADFFGTLIHEFGHALGLAHPTLTPTGGNQRRGVGKFTSATPAPNGKLDLDAGKDGLRSSADHEMGAAHGRRSRFTCWNRPTTTDSSP